MTNLAKRSDYNWRGAEIELLAARHSDGSSTHFSSALISSGIAAVEQNGVAAPKTPGLKVSDPKASEIDVGASSASGIRLVPQSPSSCDAAAGPELFRKEEI